MSSPAPDSGQTWTGADSQLSSRRASAQASGAGRHRAPGAHRARAAGAQSLVRSSSVMALGTLASRVTGLLRTLVLVPAIGQVALANSYNYANTLPNTVY